MIWIKTLLWLITSLIFPWIYTGGIIFVPTYTAMRKEKFLNENEFEITMINVWRQYTAIINYHNYGVKWNLILICFLCDFLLLLWHNVVICKIRTIITSSRSTQTTNETIFDSICFNKWLEHWTYSINVY